MNEPLFPTIKRSIEHLIEDEEEISRQQAAYHRYIYRSAEQFFTY